MIWLIIISIVLIAGVLGFLKILVTKKYLIHQYNLGVGVQYRDFTKEYYHYNKERSIDEETFIDFEMPQILKKINFTYSEIGNEYLYNLFFRENNNLDTQESIIDKLNCQKKLAESIYQLNKLNKAYVPILSIKRSLLNISAKSCLLAGLFLILDVVSIIAAIIDIENVYSVVIMLLLSILMNTQLSQKTGKISLQISLINDMLQITNKLLKINIYPDSNQTLVMNSFIHLKKMTKTTYYFNKIKQFDIFNILELMKSLFFIDIFQAVKLSRKVDQVQNDIMVLYENIGLLDVCIMIKVIRSHYDTCIPIILKDERVEIVEGYHLLIEKPIKNTVVISNDTIVTGSNASGKSTFLKMLGANLLLAKTLNISFAKEFKYYPFALISSIHMKDDIMNGDSFYVKEIKRLKQITEFANKQKSLILIDEILKGTNEKERIIIALALMKYLFKCNSMTIITTHDIELTEVFDQVDKYCFNDIKKDNKIIFDYLIKKGVCTVGNAIAIVKTLDFDQEILKEINDKIEVF